jgi:hypothetical protein
MHQKPANQMIAGFSVLGENPIYSPIPDKKVRDSVSELKDLFCSPNKM